MIEFLNRISPFQRVILGLLLGVIAGLFFGEVAGKLEIIGKAYVGLLQMTVLPYVMVSVIGGIGRLNATVALKLGRLGGCLVLFLWLLTMLSNLMLPLGYPDWQAAGFFSTSTLAGTGEFDFIDLYIPSNIYYSLSNTVVPSVVVFCLFFGVALVNVKDKDSLLKILTNVGDSLMKMASTVARFAPPRHFRHLGISSGDFAA